jgi:kynurenine formamidase
LPGAGGLNGRVRRCAAARGRDAPLGARPRRRAPRCRRHAGGDLKRIPNPDPQLSLPVHQPALVVNGVRLLENMKRDELVAKQACEFAFMMQRLKIQGGTGSTVSPIAVR